MHDSPRSPPVVHSLQTYQGSDVDIFTFGNPLNTASLFIILLHLVIESKSLVSGFSASEVARNSLCLGKCLLVQWPCGALHAWKTSGNEKSDVSMGEGIHSLLIVDSLVP